MVTPDLSVAVGAVQLKNPVLTASGTFGYGLEFLPFLDLAQLGGLVTKGLSPRPRKGNPPERIVETPAGMLNAIGLQNIGVDAFLNKPEPLCPKCGANQHHRPKRDAKAPKVVEAPVRPEPVRAPIIDEEEDDGVMIEDEEIDISAGLEDEPEDFVPEEEEEEEEAE